MLLCTALVAPLTLAGCFKSPNGANGGGPSITIELQINTGTAGNVLNPGQTASVTAVVYDISGQGVTWTVNPVNFGTLSNQTATSVSYTAPTSVSGATPVTITAASITNPNVTASGKINVTPLIILPYVFSQNQAVYAVLYSAQTLNQGQQLQIFAGSPYISAPSVTWTLTPPSGAGSLSAVTSNSVTYVAPNSVASPTTAVVTATAQSAGSAPANGSLEITVFPSGAGGNVATVNVNGGPVPGTVYPNAPFTSVTICNPGNATSVGNSLCQTIDGILIDTGSSGLRILQSEIPLLSLRGFVDANGNTLYNCNSRVDGSYLWGPVATADVYISGEVATAVPIQVISSANAVTPSGCSNGGNVDNTPQLLGANGILGVGPEPTDCVLAGIDNCDGSQQAAPPNLYYACPSVGCTTDSSPVTLKQAQQVANPIPFMVSTGNPNGVNDSNGMILQLPGVAGNAASVTGTMIFGIGTAPNNALGGATIYTLDSNDQFTTVYNGQTLTSSYIASGYNAFFFPDSLPVCAVNIEYFCPSSLTSLSATVTGATQGQSVVNFSVDNADDLLSSYPSDAAFSTLAGPKGTANTCSGGQGSCSFIWGLPFFYGRSVYTAIDQQPVTGAPGPPWWAF